MNIYISNITQQTTEYQPYWEWVSAHTATNEEQDKKLCSQLADFRFVEMNLS